MSRLKWLERAKNVVIVLLLLCAVFLGWESRMFGNTTTAVEAIEALFRNVQPRSSSGAAIGGGISVPDLPLVIALTNKEAKHYGAKYDLKELERLYVTTRSFFAESLGTEKKIQEVQESEWQTALKEPGIYYEYLTPVSLSLLNSWYGSSAASVSANNAVRRLCVTYSGGVNRLYFQDAASGKFYGTETNAQNDPGSLTDKQGPNGAVFAFQIGDSPAPYMLEFPGTAEFSRVETANPLSVVKNLNDMLLLLGVSDLMQNKYTEPDGTEEYIENDFRLRQSTSGTIRWTTTANVSAATAVSESSAVALAGQMVTRTIGSLCGDGSVRYRDSRTLSDGGIQITFAYVAAGGIVEVSPGGYAAQITVKNGIITEMELRFRRYTVSGSEHLLPERQAVAAAGSDVMLGYDDGGVSPLKPYWFKLPLSP